MSKILQFFKCDNVCLNVQSDCEMVDEVKFSPRVTRWRSKKRQIVEGDCQQKKSDEKPRETRKKKNETEEANSFDATRGSLASLTFLQTPETCDSVGLNGDSFEKLKPPEIALSIKSPPIATISTDTPERSDKFYQDIENVVKCPLRVLGKGSFGTIIQATYKGELVAAKIVPPHKTDSLENELNNFLLSHPNILKTLRVISNEDNHAYGLVIMEMFSPFTLENLTTEQSFNLDQKSVVSFMTDIGFALDYCHSRKVLHLAVNPQNILVNIKTNVCKLCEFSRSCLLMDNTTFHEDTTYNTLSSMVYTSPELLSGGPPTEKCDVYSFGITLWQMFHKDEPSSRSDLQSTIFKLGKFKKSHKSETNECLEILCKRCCETDINKRPSMKEIVMYLQTIKTS